MDVADFQEYLDKYGCNEDEEGMSEEENSRIEAELYSRFHHEAKPEHDPDITENVSLDLFNEIVKDSRETSKSPQMNSESKTRQIDSGVSSPLPQEESNYEPTKYLRSNLKNCDSDVPSFQSPEETKYKPKKQENSLEICVSSDSEDDSGIQVLNEFSKDKSVRTDATTVIDLADMSRDSECDSDIEHLPCFRNPMFQGKLIVEKEEPSDVTKDIKKIKIQQHLRFDNSDSDSSVQEIESDEDQMMGDLQLNLKGQKCHNGNERTFKQIIGNDTVEDGTSDSEIPIKNEPKKWTAEMDKFYDEVDPKLADITIEKIWKKLPDDADWSVRKPHATPSRNTPNRYFRGRHCTNCNRDGHNDKSCPDPKRGKFCIMCCEKGHLYFKCPQKHCLRCGAENESYSENCRKCRYLDTMDCRQCGGRGHIQSHCPDNWRRYHASTSAKAGLFVPDVDVHVPAHQAWCCNCARQGHYVHQCRAYSYRSVPPLVLSVVSYKEPQQFDQRHTQTATLSTESRSAKRRRLKEELKATKRAYRSQPSTPKNIPQLNEYHSQTSTPKSAWGKNSTDFILNQGNRMLEDMIESKKQRRKNKKMEKLEKKQGKLRKEYRKIDTEKSVNLQSESIALANSSLVNLMEEKLAKSKKSDSMPQVHKIRRKLMKEMHFMKRHSKGPVGAKKWKKLNNLMALI